MADFDNLTPPAKITNPATLTGAVDRDYPRHLHKWAGPDQPNTYVIVRSDIERDAKLAEGYCLTPQTAPPDEPKARKAKDVAA